MVSYVLSRETGDELSRRFARRMMKNEQRAVEQMNAQTEELNSRIARAGRPSGRSEVWPASLVGLVACRIGYPVGRWQSDCRRYRE